ncbi:MAG TPA: TolC family protein [Pirellulaceae bacterium]|jgi:cobalt-zinc-cadmium efflux system outer membrane protein
MTGKPMSAFHGCLANANPFAKQACAMVVMCLLAAAPLRAQQPITIQPASLVQPQQPLQPPQPVPEPLSPPAAIAPVPQASGDGNPPGGFRTPLALPNTPEPPPGVTVLTLEDVEQIALINNPVISRAQALVASARGNWVQVGLPPNLSWGYLGQQLGSGNIASQHMAMVDGQLITGGKLRWNRTIAEQEILRAEQVMFATQQRVLTDVRVAFYEALIAQRNLDLSQQLLNIAREANNTAQRLFNAGETSEVDYLLAQIEVSNAQNNEAIARQRHFAAWQSLRAVLGVPNMPTAALRGDLESIPDNLTWDDTLNRLLSTSPEIGAAVANLERARAALVRARRENIPDLRFQAGPMKDMGFKDGKWDGIVQLLVPLPILNRNQGGIAQAVADISAAERGIQQVELDLQNRLAPVFERYASSTTVVRRYREQILPVAEKSLELVRRGYAAGEFPFLNLLNAQRTYFQTNNLYLQALLDLRSSTAQIEGLLLNNSLGTTF